MTPKANQIRRDLCWAVVPLETFIKFTHFMVDGYHGTVAITVSACTGAEGTEYKVTMTAS